MIATGVEIEREREKKEKEERKEVGDRCIVSLRERRGAPPLFLLFYSRSSY
jgi:hypothetical protein